MKAKHATLIAVFVLFLVGLVLRILTVFQFEIIPVDALQYKEIAQFLIGGEGSYVLPREPFFPFVIGLFFLLFPNTFLTMRIITSVLGSLSIVLIYLLTRRIFRNKDVANNYRYSIGLISSCLVCFNYRFVYTDTYGVREQLFSVLLILLLYTLLLDNIKIRRIFLPLLSFLLYLTKNEALILLIGIAILVFYSNYISQKKLFIESIQNSLLILSGTLIGFIAWGVSSVYLFSDFFSTSNWMARMYFSKEFGISAPENLTLISYLFQYHSFTSIIKSFFYGAAGTMQIFIKLYGFILFPFFIISLIKLILKSSFINLWISIYPLFFIGFFAELYGWTGFLRIILPYAIISISYLSNEICEIITDFELRLTRKKVIQIKSVYFVWGIVGLFCIINLILLFI